MKRRTHWGPCGLTFYRVTTTGTCTVFTLHGRLSMPPAGAVRPGSPVACHITDLAHTWEADGRVPKQTVRLRAG